MEPRGDLRSSRLRRVAALACVCLALWLLRANPATTQTPSDGTAPDLPSGITLAMLASRTPVRCKFIGTKMVSQTRDSSRTGTALQTVTSVLNFQASSIAKIPAGASSNPMVEACRNFIRQCQRREDAIEAMLKANCREKVYRNCEIIDAAAPRCDAARVAQWRTCYPDN